MEARILQAANRCIQLIKENDVELYQKEEKNLQELKIVIHQELKALLDDPLQPKRNCLYPDHTGACKQFCDCGCPNGMKMCTND